jgi:hypothetical protein
MAQVLKEEEVGVWTQEGRTGNYAHVTWAVNVSRNLGGQCITTGIRNGGRRRSDDRVCVRGHPGLVEGPSQVRL